MSNSIARLRERAFQAQNGLCFYCNHAMWSTKSGCRKGPLRFLCTAEHLKPKAEGGENTPENIVASCYFCNSRRHRAVGAKDPVTYRVFVQRRLGEGRWHRNI